MRFFRALVCLAPCFIPTLHAQDHRVDHWVATWAAAQQQYAAGPVRAPAPAPPPPTPQPGVPARRYPAPIPYIALHNQTIRMIARTSIAGSQVRIRLDNALGLGTVAIGSAHIALRAEGSAIVPASDRTLTFSGKPTATLYAGETLLSDPVALKLPPLAHVAVSLYIPGDANGPTNHRFALHSTYISKEGDVTGQTNLADSDIRESWYWLAGIDVLAPPDSAALVTFGDSITDGDQSTLETDAAWPDILAERLQHDPATARIAVVNAGISGNRLLGDNNSGLARLYHDALSQPGVRWISVLEGINDITGGSQNGRTSITADALIAAYRQIVEAAHLYGVKAIGCTLTPYGGSNVFSDYGESVRQTVNQWIRTSGVFDYVVDFDAATRDPDNPKRYRSQVDSPDLLHPANPGYKLMGDAFDLRIFQTR